ncbi:MAG TPA: NUDIX domain-containing protein [Tissierellaceae bacterium]|nr:NUDIX domain-containing protein [Tissierellaceae bacterium]
MLKFRNIVTAFLMWNNQVLLLERSQDKEIAPGAWFGVGGHMEPEEINDPYGAAYREILEETGLDKSKIQKLDLKYIIYNRVDDYEIVVNHIFFGDVSAPYVVPNQEGSLHWINVDEALEKLTHPVALKILNHYTNDRRKDMLLGVLDWDEPYVWWYPI